MATLRLGDRVARGEPFDRQIIVRVGEAGPGLAGVRGLAAVRIRVPGDIGDRLDFARERCVGRIGEAAP